MLWSDWGLGGDPFYKGEGVGCCVMGQVSLVSVRGWDYACGVSEKFFMDMFNKIYQGGKYKLQGEVMINIDLWLMPINIYIYWIQTI